jgi:hypothetical protein
MKTFDSFGKFECFVFVLGDFFFFCFFSQQNYISPA